MDNFVFEYLGYNKLINKQNNKEQVFWNLLNQLEL